MSLIYAQDTGLVILTDLTIETRPCASYHHMRIYSMAGNSEKLASIERLRIFCLPDLLAYNICVLMRQLDANETL